MIHHKNVKNVWSLIREQIGSCSWSCSIIKASDTFLKEFSSVNEGSDGECQ